MNETKKIYDPIGLVAFTWHGFYFRPAGAHRDGGGDYYVFFDEEEKGMRYIGYLCFTIDKDDRWRANFTRPKSSDPYYKYTDDFDVVLEWLVEIA